MITPLCLAACQAEGCFIDLCSSLISSEYTLYFIPLFPHVYDLCDYTIESHIFHFSAFHFKDTRAAKYSSFTVTLYVFFALEKSSEHVSAESKRPSVLWMTGFVFLNKSGAQCPLGAWGCLSFGLSVCLSRACWSIENRAPNSPLGYILCSASPGLLHSKPQSRVKQLHSERGRKEENERLGEVRDRGGCEKWQLGWREEEKQSGRWAAKQKAWCESQHR